jgi:hypothetical protein
MFYNSAKTGDLFQSFINSALKLLLHISFCFVLMMFINWMENTASVFDSKETGLEVNADKTIMRSCLEASMQDKIAI